jgi:hypothetical protein
LGNEKLVLELLTAFEKGDSALQRYKRSVKGGGKAEPSESESNSSEGEDAAFQIPQVIARAQILIEVLVDATTAGSFLPTTCAISNVKSRLFFSSQPKPHRIYSYFCSNLCG